MYKILDPTSPHKNSADNGSSSKTRTLVIILVILITIVISMFCCYNEYFRRRNESSMFPNDRNEHNNQELFLNPYPEQIPRTESTPAESHLLLKIIRRWKSCRQAPPPYNHSQAIQAAAPPATTLSIALADEPPSYEGISL